MAVRFEVVSLSPRAARADVLVAPFLQGAPADPQARAVADALGVDLPTLFSDLAGGVEAGASPLIPTLGKLPIPYLLLLNLGPVERYDPTVARQAAMTAGGVLRRFATVACALPEAPNPAMLWEAFAEGLLLGCHQCGPYRPDGAGEPDGALSAVLVLAAEADRAVIDAALRRAAIRTGAINWARDLVHLPPTALPPHALAARAVALAEEFGMTYRVWDAADLRRDGFEAILAVGKGSAHEPRLVELAYHGGGDTPPIALVGKGVTFDAGGLHVKSAREMAWMKADMAGAAAVLAAIRAAAQLALPLNILAVTPLAENVPGGRSMRAGDAVRHPNGLTTEIVDPDAEGRLLLADTLAYLTTRGPRAIVDTATLTESWLGEEIWALLGTDQALSAALLAAGAAAGEPGWELPLWPAYRRHLHSSVADLKNCDLEHPATDTLSAALYLRAFVGETPWAHIDTAGTSYLLDPTDYWPRGATGSPTGTLIRYLENITYGDDRGHGHLSGASQPRPPASGDPHRP